MRDSDKTKEQLITELEQLRQSGGKYRTLVSRIPGFVWITDDKLRIIFFGPNIERLTGYTQVYFPLGATWANWYKRVPPHDAKEANEAFLELMRNGKPYDIEYRFQRKDGKWIWVNERSVGTYEKDGKLYADGLVTDITKRKQAEAEIKKLKEKYESVIRNIPDTIYSSLPDKTCSMVFISERYKDWSGYSPQDFYRDPELWLKTIHHEDRDRAFEHYIEARRKKKAYNYEYRVIHKDTGQTRWVRDRSTPVIDEGGKLILFDGLISDITERKEMEVRLRVFQQRLRSLASQISVAEEKERRRLAAGLHDQVTQTLAVVKLKLGTLQKEPSFNNHSKQLDEIRELVDGTIQETRLLTFELSPPILYELGLEAAVEWLTEHFQEHYGIECEFRDDGQLKPLRDEHRGILFAAVRELLINVVKHSRSRTARISIQREHNEIRVDVQDDGVGFNLLEMDHQLKTFGLFNIRERLNYLDGHVEIESDRSRGTRVTLIAPLLRSR